MYKPKKVVAEKGTKQVTQCTSAEKGCLGDNQLVPVMIFPRKKIKENMIADAPPVTRGLDNLSEYFLLTKTLSWNKISFPVR